MYLLENLGAPVRGLTADGCFLFLAASVRLQLLPPTQYRPNCTGKT